MKKLSHKEICRMGEMVNGIKLNCNIYTFENAENYISRLEPFDEKSGVCCHKVNEIIQEIKKEFPDAKGCQVDSKYYAAGVYGCIGRLSKVTVLDSEWNNSGKSFWGKVSTFSTPFSSSLTAFSVRHSCILCILSMCILSPPNQFDLL